MGDVWMPDQAITIDEVLLNTCELALEEEWPDF
jgi:hypothetical protein